MITIQFKSKRPCIKLSPDEQFGIGMPTIDDVWYIQITFHSVKKVRKLINNQIYIADNGGFLYGELAKNVLMNWNSVK